MKSLVPAKPPLPVLVSAGIGVTPMWAFFNHIREGSGHESVIL